MRIVHGNWRAEILDQTCAKKKRLRIICPFIKEVTVRSLIKACKPSDIQVITRFNLNDCYEGVSDLSALRFLLDKGANIQGVKGLHSKLYIYADIKAIITSANLTQSGLDSNHEFGCVITENELVGTCRQYFDGLWSDESNNLTYEHLDEWSKEIEQARLSGGLKTGPKKTKLKDHGRKANDIDPIVDNDIPDLDALNVVAQSRIRKFSNQAFVKFLGKSDNRVPTDFPVIEEIRRSGAYWSLGYPKTSRPRQPKDGDTMFIGRLVEGPEGNDTIIFGKARALEHVDHRDVASDADKAAPEQAWRDVWDKYIRVYDAEFISGTVGNGVRLSDLMNELEANSFMSTQRNAISGIGNTNPRLSFMQSPSVHLSNEGYAWLSEKLERQFAVHGKIPVEEYSDFYWPHLDEIMKEHLTSFVLQSTYYDKGYFNLSVSTNPYLKLGEVHGELISEKTGETFWVNIRRDKGINTTTQVRIRGNAPLRDYFQKHYKQGEEVQLRILDHKTLKLI